MKAYALLLIALASPLRSEPAATAPVIIRESDEHRQDQPLVVVAQTNPEEAEHAPVRTSARQSIISRSEVLHDGKSWTLVPNGAVLYLPEKLVDKVGVRPVGTLLPWLQFLAKNPSWVSTHETSFEQAAGEAPIPAAQVEAWQKQDRIIIAVRQGEPISVAR